MSADPVKIHSAAEVWAAIESFMADNVEYALAGLAAAQKENITATQWHVVIKHGQDTDCLNNKQAMLRFLKQLRRQLPEGICVEHDESKKNSRSWTFVFYAQDMD
jgi:hypothetical protein